MKLTSMHGLVCLLLLGSCASAEITPPQPTRAKNVIVMITDGTDWYSWEAAAYYRNGALGEESFEQFPVRLPVATFPLTTQGQGGAPDGGYNPRKAWDHRPITGEERFAGYQYVTNWATDSAAAATAMATGVKTFNGALGVDVSGRPVRNLTEVAIDLGRSAGVITSVPLCHATPAGFVVHVGNRGSYRAIAQQMLASRLSVIMGAGNPMGAKEADKYDAVGGRACWRWLNSSKSPWKVVQTREEFERLAEGGDVPERVLGVPLASSKLPNSREPGADQVPSLATMARAAINVLSRDPDGFFLMIEGGAPDWGAHNNKLDELVYELSDFYDALNAVVAWIESHGGWEENLLIVTTDHGSGLLLGPDSDKVFWQPIANEGQGQLPKAKFHTKGHTNELVRLYAKGPGSQLFVQLAEREDSYLKRYHPGWGPKYGDNTFVFRVAREAMGTERAVASTAEAVDGAGDVAAPTPTPATAPPAP